MQQRFLDGSVDPKFVKLVILSDGYTFEEKEIEAHFKAHGHTNPKTGKPVAPIYGETYFVTNYALQNALIEFAHEKAIIEHEEGKDIPVQKLLDPRDQDLWDSGDDAKAIIEKLVSEDSRDFTDENYVFVMQDSKAKNQVCVVVFDKQKAIKQQLSCTVTVKQGKSCIEYNGKSYALISDLLKADPKMSVEMSKPGYRPRYRFATKSQQSLPSVEHKNTPELPETLPAFVDDIDAEDFVDPVLIADGKTYSRQTITAWFVNHDTSLANEALPTKDMIPNLALKQAQADYKQWRMMQQVKEDSAGIKSLLSPKDQQIFLDKEHDSKLDEIEGVHYYLRQSKSNPYHLTVVFCDKEHTFPVPIVFDTYRLQDHFTYVKSSQEEMHFSSVTDWVETHWQDLLSETGFKNKKPSPVIFAKAAPEEVKEVKEVKKEKEVKEVKVIKEEIVVAAPVPDSKLDEKLQFTKIKAEPHVERLSERVRAAHEAAIQLEKNIIPGIHQVVFPETYEDDDLRNIFKEFKHKDELVIEQGGGGFITLKTSHAVELRAYLAEKLEHKEFIPVSKVDLMAGKEVRYRNEMYRIAEQPADEKSDNPQVTIYRKRDQKVEQVPMGDLTKQNPLCTVQPVPPLAVEYLFREKIRWQPDSVVIAPEDKEAKDTQYMPIVATERLATQRKAQFINSLAHLSRDLFAGTPDRQAAAPAAFPDLEMKLSEQGVVGLANSRTNQFNPTLNKRTIVSAKLLQACFAKVAAARPQWPEFHKAKDEREWVFLDENHVQSVLAKQNPNKLSAKVEAITPGVLKVTTKQSRELKSAEHIIELDLSGSMRHDERLDHAKRALKLLIESLSRFKGQYLTIVTFEEANIKIALNKQEITAESLDEIYKLVDSFVTGGGTPTAGACQVSSGLVSDEDVETTRYLLTDGGYDNCGTDEGRQKFKETINTAKADMVKRRVAKGVPVQRAVPRHIVIPIGKTFDANATEGFDYIVQQGGTGSDKRGAARAEEIPSCIAAIGDPIGYSIKHQVVLPETKAGAPMVQFAATPVNRLSCEYIVMPPAVCPSVGDEVKISGTDVLITLPKDNLTPQHLLAIQISQAKQLLRQQGIDIYFKGAYETEVNQTLIEKLAVAARDHEEWYAFAFYNSFLKKKLPVLHETEKAVVKSHQEKWAHEMLTQWGIDAVEKSLDMAQFDKALMRLDQLAEHALITGQVFAYDFFKQKAEKFREDIPKYAFEKLKNQKIDAKRPVKKTEIDWVNHILQEHKIDLETLTIDIKTAIDKKDVEKIKQCEATIAEYKSKLPMLAKLAGGSSKPYAKEEIEVRLRRLNEQEATCSQKREALLEQKPAKASRASQAVGTTASETIGKANVTGPRPIYRFQGRTPVKLVVPTIAASAPLDEREAAEEASKEFKAIQAQAEQLRARVLGDATLQRLMTENLGPEDAVLKADPEVAPTAVPESAFRPEMHTHTYPIKEREKDRSEWKSEAQTECVMVMTDGSYTSHGLMRSRVTSKPISTPVWTLEALEAAEKKLETEMQKILSSKEVDDEAEKRLLKLIDELGDVQDKLETLRGRQSHSR